MTAKTATIKKRIAKGMDLFRRFTGHEPRHIDTMPKPTIPNVGIVIGPLTGVSYKATRDGITEEYYHKFNAASRPLLVSSFDGKSIYILGGEYDFTEDGIVDRKPKTNR